MSDVHMVLRTVYLTPQMDEELKNEAFHKNISKNELIRNYIEAGMQAQKKLKGKPRPVGLKKLKSPPNTL